MVLSKRYSDNRDLHSFPTRRSSDLDDDAGARREDVNGDALLVLLDENVRQPRMGKLAVDVLADLDVLEQDRKSTRLNSSHSSISYAVFCLKKKKSNHPFNISPPQRS